MVAVGDCGRSSPTPASTNQVLLVRLIDRRLTTTVSERPRHADALGALKVRSIPTDGFGAEESPG